MRIGPPGDLTALVKFGWDRDVLETWGIPWLVSVPESRRFDAEAAEVDIALGAVVYLVVDEIEDAGVDGAVVGVKEFVHLLEPAGGDLRPGIVDELGNIIPICKNRFFCCRCWRVGAVVSQAVETDPFA